MLSDVWAFGGCGLLMTIDVMKYLQSPLNESDGVSAIFDDNFVCSLKETIFS